MQANVATLRVTNPSATAYTLSHISCPALNTAVATTTTYFSVQFGTVIAMHAPSQILIP
jgi:hypothetical protein